MSLPGPSLYFSWLRFFRAVLVAALMSLVCGRVWAQASADYTDDLPSVERVKAEIKGSDPTDTLARQVAVFTYLVTYVDRIKSNRTIRGPYTPGEARVMGAYRLAAYQISQDYAKTHTAEEAKAFEGLHGRYEMNDEFYRDWTKRLIGPQSAAAYKNAERGLAATGQKHYEQEMEQYRKDTAAQQSAESGLSNDPTAVAMRRCMELGGNNLTCVGRGLSKGMIDLVTGGEGTESITGPPHVGVVLSGVYSGAGVTTSLSFGVTNMDIRNCGDLAYTGTAYTLRKSPGRTEVVLHNSPKEIVLGMGPDGSLTGPGMMMDVAGYKLVGYRNTTTTQMVNGAPATYWQCQGPCQTTRQEPIYNPKTVRCAVGAYKPPAPRAAGEGIKPDSGMAGMLTLATGQEVTSSLPGLRMTGKYNGTSGMFLEFNGEDVIVDCGRAHVRALYTVENTPAQLLVHVENSGGPFTLAVAPDNSLRGNGGTRVNGRLISGMKGQDLTFRQVSDSCDVGSFRAKADSPSTMQVTGPAGPLPVAASAVGPAPAYGGNPAPGTYGAAASGTPGRPAGGGSVSLAISSSFPAGPNLLAGRAVQLMSERYDIALRKVGVQLPASATPGQALAAYSLNCLPPKSCPTLATAMHPYFVGKTMLDGSGHAVLQADLPPGRYFVFCSANTPDGGIVWDVPVTLSAGQNSITLEERNGEVLKAGR